MPDPELANLLRRLDENLPDRVQRAFNRWNLILRDYLRNETALRLSVGTDSATVAVQIVPGLPLPLSRIVQENREQIWLLVHRSKLASAGEGLKVLLDHWSAAAAGAQRMPLPPADYDAVGQTRSFVVGLADIAQQLEVLKRLKGLNEDVLGAYFFGARRPHVQIYWMSIGLFAATLDVSVEAMTVVVAAHELGHAYTHLGKDIDGRKWDTSSFAQADLHIVEGLAQFYTEVVCTKLADRLPEALVAFRRLRDLQSAPYKDYTTWVPDQPDAGEAVRAGMIQTRACGIRRYDIFRAAVSEQGKLLASARATA